MVTKLSEAQTLMTTDLSSLKIESLEIKGMVFGILKLLQASPAQATPVASPSSTDATTEAHASIEGEKITPMQRLFKQMDPHRQTKNDSQTLATTSVPTTTIEVITEFIPL